MIRRHSLPAEVYALVEQTPASVLLEGGKPTPKRVERAAMDAAVHGALARVRGASAAEIPALFADIESAVAAGLSAAGFFSYECGSCFEPKAGAAREPRRASRWLGLASTSAATFSIMRREDLWAASRRSSKRFQSEIEPTCQGTIQSCRTDRNQRALAPELRSMAEFALTEAEYSERIAAIHEWIRAGDVYQLNFTAPMRIERTAGASATLCTPPRAPASRLRSFSALEGRQAHPVVFAGAVFPRRRRRRIAAYRHASHEGNCARAGARRAKTERLPNGSAAIRRTAAKM